MQKEGELKCVMNVETLYGLGIGLIFLGALITLIAVVLLFISNLKASVGEKEKVKSGGVIIIGPVPIVFGMDKESVKTLLLLSTTLAVILLILTVIFYLVSK